MEWSTRCRPQCRDVHCRSESCRCKHDILAASVATVSPLDGGESDDVISRWLKTGDGLRNCAVALDKGYLHTLGRRRGRAGERTIHRADTTASRKAPCPTARCILPVAITKYGSLKAGVRHWQ